MEHDIGIEDVAPQLVAATTMRTNLARIGDDIGAGFGTLMAAVTSEGVSVVGPPLVVYVGEISQDVDGDIEVCVGIDRPLSEPTDVHSKELEGGSMATALFRGPYDQLSGVYESLTRWIPEHGYSFAGPPREIYLNDPQEVAPEELLTRVEFPVSANP